MKKCFNCGKEFKVTRKFDESGIEYESWSCASCGEEILDLKQAEHYARKLEAVQQVTFSKWGEALAMRVPAKMAKSLKLKPHQKARVIQQGSWLKVIPI